MLCNSDYANAQCQAAPPPIAWKSNDKNYNQNELRNPKIPASLSIIAFRHAERRLLSSGFMAEDGNIGKQGLKRINKLPDRLLSIFGCPDLLVTTDPAVQIKQRHTGEYFNYVRPLMTLSTFSAKLGYPVWTPYGFNQTDKLVRDFMFDRAFQQRADGKPLKIFMVWEHENIVQMYKNILRIGNLKPLVGDEIIVDKHKFKCEVAPLWHHCDFDSIWVINVRENGACLTVMKEGLDDRIYAKRCKVDP